MKVVSEPRAVRKVLAAAPRPIGFFPTMGALHEGHAAVMRQCREACATAVASIFVNPLQFGEGEDLERYPRTMDADRALLESIGVDLLFAPSEADLYPDGFETRVRVGSLGGAYEGAERPGHFDGMATVVLKLLNVVAPQKAYFSRKDAQQLAIVRRMVRDFDLPVEIIRAPILREEDGLACSSRNRYLSAAERQQALGLRAGLLEARRAFEAGERDPTRLADAARTPGMRYDYVAAVDPDRFTPAVPGSDVLVIAAARIGRTRLLDNVLLER